jgi:Putative zinc-finger
MAPHEEFLELCAASIAGELTGEERKKLSEHLKTCDACRTALEQFKITAKASVPAAADEVREVTEIDPSVSVEKAEAAFFARFDDEGGFRGSDARSSATEWVSGSNLREPNAPSGIEWGQLWMPFVSIIVFGLALGIASYQIGIRKGVQTAPVQHNDGVPGRLEEQFSDAGHEREQFRAEVATRDRAIADLRKQIQDLSAAVKRKEGTTIDREKVADSQQADTTTPKLEALQKQLDTEQKERTQQAAHASELEAKVEELSRQLQESAVTADQQKRQLDDREGTINRQQDLLAHDRDVRELMGARDLYVVEVYDVAGTGETNKPYGRLFYTKGKSLIFYAYDLDQEPGLQNASTFQAWGQRGPDKGRALNLGIFYQDNAANKRWVLKSSDPKTLEQINAVFVTVEPDAHSRKPRGKQVLFAYLRINPNHP